MTSSVRALSNPLFNLFLAISARAWREGGGRGGGWEGGGGRREGGGGGGGGREGGWEGEGGRGRREGEEEVGRGEEEEWFVPVSVVYFIPERSVVREWLALREPFCLAECHTREKEGGRGGGGGGRNKPTTDHHIIMYLHKSIHKPGVVDVMFLSSTTDSRDP